MEFDCRQTPLQETLAIAFSEVKKATHWRVIPAERGGAQKLILASGGDPDEFGGFTKFLTPLTAEEAKEFIHSWLREAAKALIPDDEETTTWRITNRGLTDYGRRAFTLIEPIIEDCPK